MSATQVSEAERRRSAYAMQSSLGAGVAGVGVGALFADLLAKSAWPILLVGLVVHVVAMVGNRRLRAGEGYRLSRFEQAGYWLCWILILALTLYLFVDLIGAGDPR